MQNKKMEIMFLALIPAGAVLSFWSIFRAIKTPEASVWMVPIVAVSLFAVCVCLASILVRQKMKVELVVASSLLLNLFFVFSLWHLLIVVLCVFVLLSALGSIRSDLDLNVKLSLWKSLNTGKFKLILGLAILITSQYYFTMLEMGTKMKIPQLDLNQMVFQVAKPIFGTLSPGYKNLAKEDLTVDQYILQNSGENDLLNNFDLVQDDQNLSAQVLQNLPIQEREALERRAKQVRLEAQRQISEKNRELILREGRAQLSRYFGTQLSGNEKMADVVVAPVALTINKFFQGNLSGSASIPILPIILATVLFFTIWPLGSILSVAWIWIVIAIFKVLLKLEIVKIEKITVERERIA